MTLSALFWTFIIPWCWKKVVNLQTLNDNFIQFMIGNLFMTVVTFSSIAITTQVYLYLGLEITKWTWGLFGYIFLLLINSGFYG